MRHTIKPTAACSEERHSSAEIFHAHNLRSGNCIATLKQRLPLTKTNTHALKRAQNTPEGCRGMIGRVKTGSVYQSALGQLKKPSFSSMHFTNTFLRAHKCCNLISTSAASTSHRIFIMKYI